MPEIKHERLGKIFRRCGRGIAADVVIGIEVPRKIPGVRGAEGVTESFGTDQPAVGISDGMGILVAEDIPQGRVATAENVGEAGPGNPRDVNLTAAAIPLPAVGDAERNEMDVHGVNGFIVETEPIELATDIASGRTQLAQVDEVHIVRSRVRGQWEEEYPKNRALPIARSLRTHYFIGGPRSHRSFYRW